MGLVSESLCPWQETELVVWFLKRLRGLTQHGDIVPSKGMVARPVLFVSRVGTLVGAL